MKFDSADTEFVESAIGIFFCYCFNNCKTQIYCSHFLVNIFKFEDNCCVDVYFEVTDEMVQPLLAYFELRKKYDYDDN